MKKVIVLLILAGTLTLVGCRKEKMCRCSVLGYQTMRLVEIKRGNCEDIRFVYYDNAGGLIPKDRDLTDSVLCTDYLFESDNNNIFSNN